MASEAEQNEEPMPDAPEAQPQAAQSAAEKRSKRKKKHWGEETDLGKQILEGADIEQLQVPAAEAPAVEQQQEHQAAENEAPKAKKRRSRWEPECDRTAAAAATTTTLPGGLQISLPPSIAALVDVNVDPHAMELQRQLNVVNQKLQLLSQGKYVEDSPERDRSPSPEPVYNESGARVNTREARAKEKILRKRNEIITELIKANPNYKPPADYRPEKKYRKLRIPIDEYPGYNFIGLIIGPRGNTQKRMERVRGSARAWNRAAGGPLGSLGVDQYCSLCEALCKQVATVILQPNRSSQGTLITPHRISCIYCLWIYGLVTQLSSKSTPVPWEWSN
eukprot:GHUV01055032.1.p1 GENE.GHUV01055032.1~~GHUV01055032.1.p1  ORF type:complete len:335 (+),score=62.64 GHUV01055032.1:265-1269(+)